MPFICAAHAGLHNRYALQCILKAFGDNNGCKKLVGLIPVQLSQN